MGLNVLKSKWDLIYDKIMFSIRTSDLPIRINPYNLYDINNLVKSLRFYA